MKKLVMRLDLEDDKTKQKALKIVSAFKGIDSITVDMKGKTMTVIGTVDPVRLVSKLRKYWHADIITVGPAKEPEKKEEAKQAAAEGKKEEGKKEEGKGGEKKEEGKKEGGGDKKDNEAAEEALRKKQQLIPEHLLEIRRARQYNPYMGNYPPYMGNYPPYMAMANPNMSHSHPQMYHPQPQPSYYAQRVVEEDNPSGCSIF